MKKTQLVTLVILVIIAIGVFCCIQITNAATVLEGHDFTIETADANYVPGELLLRRLL